MGKRASPRKKWSARVTRDRGGAGLSASRRKTLEAAKDELRRLFDKQKA